MKYKEIVKLIGLIIGLFGIIVGFWDKFTAIYFIVLSLWICLVCGSDS